MGISGANGPVLSILITNGAAYIGGRFSMINGAVRANLAALDAKTGEPLDWNSNVSGQVSTLAFKDGVLYVGGQFGFVGGQQRSSIAAIDAKTGQATPWNAQASGVIGVVALSDRLLVAGEGPVLTAVSLQTGQPLGWRPDLPNAIRAVALAATEEFAYAATSTKTDAIFKVSITNAAQISEIPIFNPQRGETRPFEIRGLAQGEGNLYVLSYTLEGLAPLIPHHSNLQALSLASGAELWRIEYPALENTDRLHVVAVAPGEVYVGGASGNSLPGVILNYSLLAYSPAGASLGWNPAVTQNRRWGTVRSIGVGDGMVYVGGEFNDVGGVPHQNLAAFGATNSSALRIRPLAGNNLQLKLYGEAGQSLVLEGSTNLHSWQSLGQHSLSNAPAVISVNSSSAANQFYRTRSGTPP